MAEPNATQLSRDASDRDRARFLKQALAVERVLRLACRDDQAIRQRIAVLMQRSGRGERVSIVALVAMRGAHEELKTAVARKKVQAEAAWLAYERVLGGAA